VCEEGATRGLKEGTEGKLKPIPAFLFIYHLTERFIFLLIKANTHRVTVYFPIILIRHFEVAEI
jgi:hypothetical protein